MKAQRPEVTTVAGLQEALAGGKAREAGAPLAALLASGHGPGDIDPVDNLLGEIEHLADGVARVVGNELHAGPSSPSRDRLLEYVLTAVISIEGKAAVITRLLDRERAERRASGSARSSLDALDPNTWRDPDYGEAERHLLRCLEMGHQDAIESYNGMGSVAKHYAPLARLLALMLEVLNQHGDELHGSPEMVNVFHEAGTVLEFQLAEWRAVRANAAEAKKRGEQK